MNIGYLMALLVKAQREAMGRGFRGKGKNHGGGVLAMPKTWGTSPKSGSTRERRRQYYRDAVVGFVASDRASMRQAGFGRKWAYK